MRAPTVSFCAIFTVETLPQARTVMEFSPLLAAAGRTLGWSTCGALRKTYLREMCCLRSIVVGRLRMSKRDRKNWASRNLKSMTRKALASCVSNRLALAFSVRSTIFFVSFALRATSMPAKMTFQSFKRTTGSCSALTLHSVARQSLILLMTLRHICRPICATNIWDCTTKSKSSAIIGTNQSCLRAAVRTRMRLLVACTTYRTTLRPASAANAVTRGMKSKVEIAWPSNAVRANARGSAPGVWRNFQIRQWEMKRRSRRVRPTSCVVSTMSPAIPMEAPTYLQNEKS
mmetsp:Transcript_3490/g.8415  ORF Transcript_3490/g.8415 Transcript_3490/m.8415 type:complete len:288 (-) Transcript_3490:278-1141(-)